MLDRVFHSCQFYLLNIWKLLIRLRGIFPQLKSKGFFTSWIQHEMGCPIRTIIMGYFLSRLCSQNRFNYMQVQGSIKQDQSLAIDSQYSVHKTCWIKRRRWKEYSQILSCCLPIQWDLTLPLFSFCSSQTGPIKTCSSSRRQDTHAIPQCIEPMSCPLWGSALTHGQQLLMF